MVCTSICIGEIYQNRSAGLVELPKDISTTITIIDLTDNLITNLDILSTFANASTLEAAGNQLTEFPNLSGIASNVEIIVLDNNRISHISPERLDILVSLQQLYLGWNQISEFPDVDGSATSMIRLEIRNNILANFPMLPKLGSKRLSSINAKDNLFTDMPEEAAQALPHIEDLHLSSNQIHDIANIVKYCPKLRLLYMAGNVLAEIPDELLGLNHFEELNVKHNNIESIPNVCRYRRGSPLTLLVYGNPIKCDCRLTSVIVALDKGGVLSIDTDSQLAQCSTPAQLAGRPIRSLTLDEVACTGTCRF